MRLSVLVSFLVASLLTVGCGKTSESKSESSNLFTVSSSSVLGDYSLTTEGNELKFRRGNTAIPISPRIYVNGNLLYSTVGGVSKYVGTISPLAVCTGVYDKECHLTLNQSNATITPYNANNLSASCSSNVGGNVVCTTNATPVIAGGGVSLASLATGKILPISSGGQLFQKFDASNFKSTSLGDIQADLSCGGKKVGQAKQKSNGQLTMTFIRPASVSSSVIRIQ